MEDNNEFSIYWIESFRQVYDDTGLELIFWEHHEIRVHESDFNDWEELKGKSKEDIINNWSEIQELLYLGDLYSDPLDEVDINLKDGSDVDEYPEHFGDYDSSTAHHEDGTYYCSYEEVKKSFEKLIELSRNYHKKTN